MVSGLDGTVTLTDGTARLSGSFSKLDTAALVEAAVQLKRLPAVRLEIKITENETRSAAFDQLNTLLQALSSASGALRNPPGSSAISSNLFEQKLAFLDSDSSTQAAELLGVNAENTAANGTYEIEVQQIATAHKISSTTIADPNTALGVAETLTVNLAGASADETVGIDVTTDMTARDIASAINNNSATTGVRASLVKISDSDYRLVVTAEETNKAIELVGTTGDTTLALGISSDNGSTYDNVLQSEQPAQIALDGIGTVIERDSNEFSDVIDGVTFDLFKAEPGTTVTVEIEQDLTAIRTGIDEFVAAYNDVRTFLNEQSVVDGEGNVSETSILFGDNIVRTLSQTLGSDLAALVSGLSSDALATLRGVGVELNADNLLTIDEGTLNSALVDNLDEVRDVFEYGFSADSDEIRIIGREGQFDLGTFTITVPAGAIDGTNLQVDGEDAFEVDGNTLRGIEGTDYEGLTLAYSRDTSDTGEAAEDIAITTTLGIAERIYQSAETYAKPNGGVIADELDRLNSLNVDYEEQILEIETRIAIYQTALIEKYAKMEQAIAQADAMAKQLKAMLGIDDN